MAITIGAYGSKKQLFCHIYISARELGLISRHLLYAH
ncbi:hypothetical protein FHR25_004793 [Yokenella regensburgei]|nr:hypothetical protein FHR25_004793 [Yokenella regensburgei]